MARFLSLRHAFFAIGSLTSLAGLAACTAILGDFEVASSSGTPDTGTTDTSTQTDASDEVATDTGTDAKPQGLNGARGIAAGARHTCALLNLGEVYCWGDNSQGQLAQPTTVTRLAKPIKVDLNGVAKSIAAGANHTCAVMMNDDIQCWGQNASGQAGTGDQNTPAQPHVVRAQGGAPKQWEEVSPGAEHTCAVDQGGQVYCWGNNAGGRAGEIPASSFLATPAGADKVGLGSLAASVNHTCARPLGNSAMGARCWGTEDKGALGNGAPANQTTTASVNVALGEVKQVVVGGGHSCALDANNDAKCWGDNAFGQLGINPAGNFFDAPPPGKVGTVPIAAISAGGATTCGISVMNRTLACVGSNSAGQLGRGGVKDNSPHPDALPVQRPDGSGQNLEAVAAVSVGREHVCAIVGPSLLVLCWGEGSDGQLGDSFGGQPRTLPVLVSEPSN